MEKGKAVKLATGILSTALFLSIPSAIAHADSFISAEQGIAGISAVLENTTDEQLTDAYNASVDTIKSPYEDLGVSIADKGSYVNIRKEPTTDSKIVGRLDRGCAANIIKRMDGDWVKIESGKVKGYIASNFLAIGEDAESMVDKYATKLATVNTQTLRVRAKKSTKSDIVTLVPQDETYVVTKEYGDWVGILLGDDDNGKEDTGYVNKQFVTIKVKFKYAQTLKEIKKQREAIQAEKERKAELAAEKARKAEPHISTDSNSGSGSSSSPSRSYTSSDSDSGSGSGSKVANYALKFVGNPYVWGGTSLTGGTDCSGFVQSVYGDFGYSLPRTSREQAASAGRVVSESDLQPGDLVFYASGGVVHHVAIYIGGGRIVHAANSRQGIITSNYKYSNIYCCRRIIG